MLFSVDNHNNSQSFSGDRNGFLAVTVGATIEVKHHGGPDDSRKWNQSLYRDTVKHDES